MKIFKNIHLKNVIFAAVKICSILHGRVFVMISYYCYNVAVYTYFFSSVLLVSLLNLLALAIDHYIAIVKPLHYSSIVTNSRIRVCIVLIWLMSFATIVIESIPEIINYYKNIETENSF